MNDERALALENLAVFQGLDSESLLALRSIARAYTLMPGERLFVQGEIAHSFYIVLRGGVRLVEHTSEGKDVNLKVYGPDDVFGLLAIYGGFAHHAEIVAVGHSDVLGFNGQETRTIMGQHPNIALKIIDTLIEHVHHAHSRIRQMAAEKTERRLARALLHFCRKFGQHMSDRIELEVGFSQQDIAEFTGTTMETVNRLLREWESKGYVERRRMQITVLDVDALRRIADDLGDIGKAYLIE